MTNIETEKSKNYRCGDVLFDRQGVFSGGSPTFYQLLSRDNGQWTCVHYLDRITDGKVRGGAMVEIVWNTDLDRAEKIGTVTLPIP